MKLVIAGGFGVGKTTAVASISEITPLTTEALMTTASVKVDDTADTPDKTTTTVALDFGCLTVDNAMKLYLFGTPGQDRFGFMWNDIARGALGALIVVDSRRLQDGYPAVDYFERLNMPFVVAVNLFNGSLHHDLDAVRWALAIHSGVPVVAFDARDKFSVRDALLVLLRQALAAVRSRRKARNAEYDAQPVSSWNEQDPAQGAAR
ncbi:ATP/GTP-binding protein [Streptomyces sp. NPDC046977]|uniref:GTP-binding protein n=1 Tax=Streptomyces sp. NPDC046977 TaxID=3154703 RepID=UPI0033E26F3D